MLYIKKKFSKKPQGKGTSHLNYGMIRIGSTIPKEDILG